MFDDVERRRFLVEPARKDAFDLVLRIADVDLNERAGELLCLPRRRGFTRAQTDDDVADAKRLAGLHGQFARQAVALVEQADHRDALGHRRRAWRDRGHGLRNVDRFGLGFGLELGLRFGHVAAARAKREQADRRAEEQEARHCAVIVSAPAGSAGALAASSPPVRLMTDPIRPIMSTEPCVSMIMSPCFKGTSDPPGMSAI